MRITRLVLAEILGRPLNFLLSLLVIVIAAFLFVVGPTIINGYAADTRIQLDRLKAETDSALDDMKTETDKELAELEKRTIRIVRDLGVNLRIVHKDTVMGDLYTNFVAVDFPEDYVQVLATAEQVETIVHLIATLQEKVKWNDRTALLVGMLPVLTDSQKNAEKQHMAEPVEQGTVVVGFELAAGVAGSELITTDADGNDKLDVGDELDVLGTSFKVAQIRPEAGGLEDIQLILHLHDAQKLVEKEGRIHQIMALNCKCKGDRLSVIRKELEGVLPDTKVTEHRSRATAREQQRDLVAAKRQKQLELLKTNREQQAAIVKANREHGEKTLTGLVLVLLPLEVLVAALIVGVMTWLNVRERRAEIGVLRALGKRTGQIALLFLSRAVFVGVLGGLVACLVCLLASTLLAGPASTLRDDLGLAHFDPSNLLLLLTIVGAPIVTAMASYLPMLSAVSQDPAQVLMDS